MASLTAEIEDDPTSALHYLARGDEWLECGELDRAIADYNAAIRLDPDFGNAYVNRHITGAVVQRQPFGGWLPKSNHWSRHFEKGKENESP